MNLYQAFSSLMRLLGLLFSCIVLFIVSVSIKINTAIAHLAVLMIEKLTGAEAKQPLKAHSQRHETKSITYCNPEKHGIIDEKQTLSNSITEKFTGLSENALIAKTYEFLSPDVLFGSKNPAVLAEDFQFIFPVIGPLSKAEFCKAFGQFQTEKAFPLDDGESSSNYFGFTIDPTEPNRVWFFARSKFIHKGLLQFGKMKIEPTFKTINITPQVFSVSFDKEGKCYKFTGGYSVDRSAGNCDGLGGLFGIIHSIRPKSLPFPEGKPWVPSVEWEIMVKRIPQIAEEWNSFLSAFS